MLSQKQIKDVCLGYDPTYKRCRYLTNDDEDHTKFYCLKKTATAQEIDVELSEFVSGEFKKGKDPRATNFPMGDNCPGYPVFRHILQGYDQK